MSTAVCELRSTPIGEPVVPELVQPGDVVRTNYGTGPFRVIEVAGPYGHGCYSLILTKPESRSNKPENMINELVAVGQRLLRLHASNDDEVFVISKGEKQVTTKTKKPSSQRSSDQQEQIVAIPIEKLHDHPGNPDSTEPEIMEMVGWLKENGQDEPLDVRPLPEPIGHYQVLSGKRRLAAAQRLGWDSLQVRIRRDLDDEFNAVAFAARRNIERRTEGDLRKAHWIRYQVTTLGMTVADAATTNGIAQGTASNLMGALELCDRFPYWRDLLIAGEMSSAHLRPIKKYRDYPAVMKLLQNDHAKKKADSHKQSWMMEDFISFWGTRESIEYTVEQLIASETRALRFEDTISDERAYDEPKFDAAKLTPEQRKKLKIVSIPAPGDKSDRMVERCFDVKQWQILQAAAKNNAAKKAADKSSRSGATGSASANRTPAEQRKIDQQRAEQLQERVLAWRHDWLKQLIANRLEQCPLIVMLIRTMSTRVRFHDVHYDTRDHVWGTLADMTAEQLADYDRNHAIAIIADEEKNAKYPRLSRSHVDDLARMAGIDVAAEWSAMQQGTKPVEFETFFWLHDKTQLEKLAGELKVNVVGLDTKKKLVTMLTSQPRTLPLPKSIATLKPAAKKPRGKK